MLEFDMEFEMFYFQLVPRANHEHAAGSCLVFHFLDLEAQNFLCINVKFMICKMYHKCKIQGNEKFFKENLQ
jgi:hypothetical protein